MQVHADDLWRAGAAEQAVEAAAVPPAVEAAATQCCCCLPAKGLFNASVAIARIGGSSGLSYSSLQLRAQLLPGRTACVATTASRASCCWWSV